MRLFYSGFGQKSVHQVHGEAEDLGRTAELLTDLQHPVGDDLPHVRLDLNLNCLEVILILGEISVLVLDKIDQNSVVLHQCGVRLGLDL